MSNEATTEAEAIGAAVEELLSLKRNDNNCVNTTWGDKTLLGLGLTIKRIVDEATQPLPQIKDAQVEELRG